MSSFCYYRDNDMNLYRILDQSGPLYVCEGLKGPYTGRIVNFHKVTGKMM